VITAIALDPLGPLVRTSADDILAALGKWIVQGADSLLSAVINFLNNSTTPNFGALWFSGKYAATMKIASGVALLLLVLCALSAIIAGDPGRLVRAVVMQLPLAMLGTVVAVVLAQRAVNIVDAICRQLLPQPATATLAIGQNVAVKGAADAILGGLLAIAALMLWLELLVREAAIYATVVLLPFFLAGLVWPATAKFAIRAVETLIALILAKLVIVSVLALGLNALDVSGVGDLGSLMAGASLCLFASLAPWALLRLVPVVEGAAVTHLDGQARRPLQATQVPAVYHQIPYMITDALRQGLGAGATAGAAAATGGVTAAPAAVQAVMAAAAHSGDEDRLDTQPRPLLPSRSHPADGG
jgi:hypothetical protein